MARRQNIVSEISNDFLTCHICWETYKEPKTLPCGHFFCRCCLYSFCNSRNRQPNIPPILAAENAAMDSCRLIHCPTCRKVAGEIHPEGGVPAFVDRLPDNFYVNSLIDLVKDHYTERSRSRSDRGDERSTQQFEDTNFQRSKSASDEGMAFSAGHVQGTQKTGLQVACLEHPNENITVYCTTHNKVLCGTCRVTDHSECTECISVEAAEYRFIRPRVQHMLTCLNHQRQALVNSLRHYIRQQQTLTADSFAIEKRIDEVRLALETKLQENFSKMKDECKRIVSEQEELLKERSESIKMKEAIISESVENLETLGRKGCALEIASLLGVFDMQMHLEPVQRGPEEGDRLLTQRICLNTRKEVGSILASNENIFGQIVLEIGSDSCLTEPGEGAAANRNQSVSSADNLGESVSGTEQQKRSVTTPYTTEVVQAPENAPRVRRLGRAKESKEPFVTITKKTSFTISSCADVGVFGVMNNGDVVCLTPSEKSVILCRPSGLVTDQVMLPTVPLGLSTCKDYRRKMSIAVTGYGNKIYFLSTSPRLRLVRAIPTRVQYSAISKIPKRLSMVALADGECPPVIDLISLQGMVLKTFGNTDAGDRLFREPRYIATCSEFLFVPDGSNLKILSWDREGVEIIQSYSTRDRVEIPFKSLKTVCRLQDMVLLADWDDGKLHALCLRNEIWVLATVLEDKSLIREGSSLTAVNNDTVYLCRGNSVHVYLLEYNSVYFPNHGLVKSPRSRAFSIEDQYLTL